MAELNLFDRVDHLMVEVADPVAAYQAFFNTFGLPQAWPLVTTECYTSIGVDFGNAILELIAFNERFGVKDLAQIRSAS